MVVVDRGAGVLGTLLIALRSIGVVIGVVGVAAASFDVLAALPREPLSSALVVVVVPAALALDQLVLDRYPIDVDHVATDLDGLALRGDHPLEVVALGRARMAEHDHLAGRHS